MNPDTANALLAALAEALASGVGPDGRPSRQARRRAKAILGLARDHEALAAVEKEAGSEGART